MSAATARDVVFQIIANAPNHKVEGRKKFQKLAHLLLASGEEFDIAFRIHHYGPFSDELADELYDLAWNDEVLESHSPVLPLGTHQYVYALPNEFTSENRLSTKGVEILEYLDNLSTAVLEVASTIIYFRNSLGQKLDNAIESTTELKPFARRGSLIQNAKKVIEKVDSAMEARP